LETFFRGRSRLVPLPSSGFRFRFFSSTRSILCPLKRTRPFPFSQEQYLGFLPGKFPDCPYFLCVVPSWILILHILFPLLVFRPFSFFDPQFPLRFFLYFRLIPTPLPPSSVFISLRNFPSIKISFPSPQLFRSRILSPYAPPLPLLTCDVFS